MDAFDPKSFWEDRLSDRFAITDVGYKILGRHFNQRMYRLRRRIFLNRILAMGTDFSQKSVLDVGCGTGFWIKQWKEVGARKIVGVDITKVSVDRLKACFPECEFYQANIGDDIQGLKKMRFDAISAFDVLFHIVDDQKYERAIGNIHTLLKPGGLFIWSDNFLHKKEIRDTCQVSRTLKDIENILENTGFKILERRPMFFFMNAPVDSESKAHRAFWNNIERFVRRSELAGALVSSALYPLERILLSFLHEGPSTEMMICQKPQRP